MSCELPSKGGARLLLAAYQGCGSFPRQHNNKILYKMAAGSPFRKRHNFAETDPRIRTELKKSDLLLKKEIERLEKQTRAANNYISDHQQALKMSWRRLEMQRKQDASPTVNRRTRRTGSLSDGKKRLLFSTTVSMDIPSAMTQSSPQSRPLTRGQQVSIDDDLTSSGSVPTLLPPIDQDAIISRPYTRGMKSSPYISSPHAFRRQAPKTLPPISSSSSSSNTAAHPLLASTTASANSKPRANSTGSSSSGNEADQIVDDNTVTIPANSKTVNKEALLKAKELMNFKDYDPKSFQQFYSTTDVQSDSLGMSRILLDELHQFNDESQLSEEEMMKQLTLEEQEKLKKAQEEVSNVIIIN